MTRYTINAERFYKAPSDGIFVQVLQFTASDISSDPCALDLQVGTKYVVGMNVQADSSLLATACGPTRAVENLTEIQLEALENEGCSPPE